MKTISIDEYNPNMGTLISLEDNDDFKSIKGSININMYKLLNNPSKYLEKNKRYYFYCYNGSRARRVIQVLSMYGYSVYKVTK